MINPTSGEKELGRILAVPAHFLQVPATREAVGAVLHQIERQPQVRIVKIRIPGGHDHQVAEQAIGNIGLGAVEHHGVTFLLRQGADAGQVAAGIRLGHGDRGDDVPGDTPRKIATFLVVAAKRGDIGNHDVAVQRGRQPVDPGTGHLFGQDGGITKIPAPAAVDRRHVHAQKAGLPHLVPNLPRDGPVLFPLIGMGSHLSGQEFP